MGQDLEYMREIGKKGGSTFRQNRAHMARISRMGVEARKQQREATEEKPAER